MMTKNQLETFGRTLGVELDRRLNKSKLINELVDHTKEELKTVATVSVPVVESVVAKVEEVVNTAKYDLVQQGGFWSVSEGIKEVYKSSSEKNALRFIKKRS
jgi:hypothetical protein